MLNPFPELFAWSFFAPLFLRVVLGFYFVALARTTYKRGTHSPARHPHQNDRAAYAILALVELVVGILLVLGLYTQIVAAIGVAFGFIALWLKAGRSHEAPESTWFYLLATTVALTLIVLGAGIFAFDLPL